MKIMINAYLDNNIGDDLMIKLLVDYFDDHTFYLYTNKTTVMNTFNDCDNIIIRQSQYIKKDLDIMDVFLTIGGSIFSNLNDIKGQVARLKKILLLKKAKRKKLRIATIGCNLGPYTTKRGLLVTRLELKYNNLITVRDKNSYELLKGFKGLKNYHLFQDIVYNYNYSDKKIKKSGLGISVYRSVKQPYQNFKNYHGLALIADEFINKTEKMVRLFAFDTENENDLSAAHHVFNQAQRKDKIEIIPYLGEQETFINKIDECEKLIAIRFHSAVLADILNIPFLPIIYSNKMSSFLKDKNYSGKSFRIDELNSNTAHVIVNLLFDDDKLYNKFHTSENNSINHFKEFSSMINE